MTLPKNNAAVAAARSKRHVNTEDRYSYTASKDTTSRSTVKLAQGCVAGFKDVNTSKGIEALMTGLTQQLVPSVIEADRVFFQSYSVGDIQHETPTVHPCPKRWRGCGWLNKKHTRPTTCADSRCTSIFQFFVQFANLSILSI